VYPCVCTYVYACVGGQLTGIGFLLLPCECQELNSGHQAWPQAPLLLCHLAGPVSSYIILFFSFILGTQAQVLSVHYSGIKCLEGSLTSIGESLA